MYGLFVIVQWYRAITRRYANVKGIMPVKGPTRKRLPDPLPEGFILMDSEKRHWKLGKIIGNGGFGLIHLASPASEKDVGDDAIYVIKVEHQENGPLFSELKFYQRAAKSEHIKTWMKSRKLSFLGIPTYWGSGLAEHNGKSYRFMVIDRLGVDLQKVLEAAGNQLDKASALKIGCQLLDILEFIHEHEYIHGDIKSANLLLGFKNHKEIYLADYGLAFRYRPNGAHKHYKEDPKKGHNGTIEFTSIDAHKGVAPSRRSDLEILGYCMLQWLCGKLPWEQDLKDPVAVQQAKVKFMENLPTSVNQCFCSGYKNSEIVNYLSYVSTLKYEERPQYQKLRNILLNRQEASRSKCVDLSGIECMDSWLLSVPENSKRIHATLSSQNHVSSLPVGCSPRGLENTVDGLEHWKYSTNQAARIERETNLMFQVPVSKQIKGRGNLLNDTECSKLSRLKKRKAAVITIDQDQAKLPHPTEPSVVLQDEIRRKSDIFLYGAAVMILLTLIILLLWL